MAEINLEGYGTFELPESFNLKEMRIIERYSGGHQEGFEISKICGVIHVAIMRVKPQVPFEEIEGVIDEIDVEKLEKILKDNEAGQSPPAPSNSENSESSSAASATSSDADPESVIPETSGSPASDGFQSFHAMSGN